jgi:hypothetical protein
MTANRFLLGLQTNNKRRPGDLLLLFIPLIFALFSLAVTALMSVIKNIYWLYLSLLSFLRLFYSELLCYLDTVSLSPRARSAPKIRVTVSIRLIAGTLLIVILGTFSVITRCGNGACNEDHQKGSYYQG